MKPHIIRLTDRGRGLEWLSLGFGLLLVANLVFALLSLDTATRTAADLSDRIVGPSPTLALACGAIHLVAIAAIASGLAVLLRSGPWLLFGIPLAALVVLLGDRTVVVWLALGLGSVDWYLPSAWGVGSLAQVLLVACVAQGIRDVARAEGGKIPLSLLGVVMAAEIARFGLLAGFPLGEEALALDPLLPWSRGALIAIASLVSLGLVLLAIREASRVVRGQIWSGELGASSPARAGDWQRGAAGLDAFGAFLIGKISIAAAAVPLALMVALVAGPDAYVTVLARAVPAMSVLCSAGMVLALLACRRLPDPPDARAGFAGAALLVTACLAGDVYTLSASAGEPLAGAVSSLAHLVAYLAVLRSVGRVGERIGEEEFVRRARPLACLAIGAVGGATVAGYLLVPATGDPGFAIAAPVVVAACAFAALLPCAILIRQLATRLRQRFAAPPRARASFSRRS